MIAVRQVQQDELVQFMRDIEEGRCLLLDVRESHEYEAGHLPSARSAPLSRAEEWSRELDKEKPIILYCRAGNRSRKASEYLVNRGFKEVYCLEGGYLAWASRHRPL